MINNVEGKPPIDKKYFHEIVRYDREQGEKILCLFYKNAYRAIDELQASSSDGLKKEWRHSAHDLVGTAACIGAFPLAKLANDAQNLWEKPEEIKIKLLHNMKECLSNIESFQETLLG